MEPIPFTMGGFAFFITNNLLHCYIIQLHGVNANYKKQLDILGRLKYNWINNYLFEMSCDSYIANINIVI